MIRCIAAEWMKLKHSRIWLILIILPIISVLIGSANFFMNQGVLQNEWYSLWSQVSLFYGEFFFPLLIAICCAYVWRLEHFNHNWYMIMTAPVKRTSIFIAKIAVVSLLLFFVQGFFFILYIIAGNIIGLSTEIPGELVGWFLRGWMASITIGTLQLALSMRFRSFALPIGIGLCATVFGLAMYIAELGMFFPHSLLTIGMGVLSQSGLSSFSEHLQFLITNILYILVIGLLATNWLRRTDIVA